MSVKKFREENILSLLVIAVCVLTAIASSLLFFRLDLTQDKKFSISKISRNLYKEIPETLSLTYYVSGRLNKDQSNPKHIEDLLRSYAAASHGKIRVQVKDADASGEISAMADFGIPSQQYQVVERNQRSVANVYTGIVVEYLDRFETIPLAWDLTNLEYELTRTIRKAVSGSGGVLEVLVGDADKTWANEYKLLAQALKQSGWTVREHKAGAAVGDDVEVMLVLGNSKLDDYDLYPVDQFIMRGGKVFFGVKGVDVMTTYGMYAQALSDNATLKLLKTYGVDIKPELVLDANCLTIPFQMQDQASGQLVYSLVRYPHWLSVNQKFVSAENPVTSRFAGLDLFWASPLTLDSVAGLQAEVIAKTTTQAWKSTKDFPINPQQEASFYLESQETLGQYGLVGSISGNFPSYFKARKAPTREGEKAQWMEPVESSAEARIVVVSSADFATDLINYSKSEFNVNFVSACADWLSSDSDLVSIKTRSYKDNRLNKIEDEKRKNSLIFLTYLVTLGLVPLGVVAFGVIRFVRRKRRASVARGKEIFNEISN